MRLIEFVSKLLQYWSMLVLRRRRRRRRWHAAALRHSLASSYAFVVALRCRLVVQPSASLARALAYPLRCRCSVRTLAHSLDPRPRLLHRMHTPARTLTRSTLGLACSLMQPTCTYLKTECRCLIRDSDSASFSLRRTQNTRVE